MFALAGSQNAYAGRIKSSAIRPAATLSRRATIRVLVIGLGLIGRQRAAALSGIDGAALVASVDPRLSGPHPADVRHFATLEEVPPNAYDAAIVAVPHDTSTSIAASVLEAGKPVLVEKPLGIHAVEAGTLETLAHELTTPSFVGYNYRFLPAVEQLMRLARTGELGPLRNIDMLVGHGGHPDSAAGWKLDPARAGGGVLLDPGVHLLDLLLQLLPLAACAAIDATRGFWQTGIEEDVVAVFREGDTIATVRVSHIRWVNTFRVEAFGTDGYAIAEGRGGNYGPMSLRSGRRWAWSGSDLSQRASETVQAYGSHNESLADELAAVVAIWRGEDLPAGAPSPASMSEARRVTELCELLYPRIA
jgi:1,5-anhydro-D-fructose reductase (1,5-anhydro-D-mannitol-forming)